jgi:hypothetical protein
VAFGFHEMALMSKRLLARAAFICTRSRQVVKTGSLEEGNEKRGTELS